MTDLSIQHLEMCTQTSCFLSPWVKNMETSSLASVYLVALTFRGIAGRQLVSQKSCKHFRSLL